MLHDIYTIFYFRQRLMLCLMKCLTICLLHGSFCSVMLIICLNYIPHDVLNYLEEKKTNLLDCELSDI